ncbi:HNH endonuclease signature motif containing protein [Cellulomonas composti]|uniref:HNH nuclease domain-containing protein n=1 Tax=Cellulomonas composti TaxID=266130 RepID=A0A511JA02_9CELL|nr:HNH endonuclease signature motif containing protein [Cellulomonas composti]GEL94826.1 hypothetical protein CCO02nite_14840 [Cellulomonas composti]
MSAMTDGATPDDEPRRALVAVSDETSGVGPIPEVAALQLAIDALAGLVPGASTSLDGQSATETMVALATAAGRLTAIAAALLPVVEADGWWALRGARTVTTWLAGAARMPWARAAGIVRMGRAFASDLPETAAGAVAGEIPVDNALTLARLAPTTKLRREALAQPADACGEPFLAEHARGLAPETFTRLVRRWAAAADTGADERGYRKATDREFFTISPTTNGMHLSGFLTTEHGASLRAALDSLMGTPAPDDRRTTTQRRAQALADLSRLGLDHGLVGTGAGARIRPHVSCVVDHDTFRRLVEDESTRDPFDARLDDPPDDPPDSRHNDPPDRRHVDPPGSPHNDPPDRRHNDDPPRCHHDDPLDHPLEDPLDDPLDHPLEDPLDDPLEDPLEDPLDDPLEGPLEGPLDDLLEGPLDERLYERLGANLDQRLDETADADPEDLARPRGVRLGRLRPVSDEERFAVTEIVGAGPVPGHVLQRLACDGAIGRLVFGPASELIDVGRSERRFTAARRRAIVARDQTCRYPSCGAPASLGELHHVVPWSQGGSTDANAGILLCYHHHDVVHRLHLQIRRRKSGGWRFTTATGHRLDAGS